MLGLPGGQSWNRSDCVSLGGASNTHILYRLLTPPTTRILPPSYTYPHLQHTPAHPARFSTSTSTVYSPSGGRRLPRDQTPPFHQAPVLWSSPQCRLKVHSRVPTRTTRRSPSSTHHPTVSLHLLNSANENGPALLRRCACALQPWDTFRAILILLCPPRSSRRLYIASPRVPSQANPPPCRCQCSPSPAATASSPVLS